MRRPCYRGAPMKAWAEKTRSVTDRCGARAILLIASLLAIVVATADGAEPKRVAAPQRIILVSMDTVRAESVSGYGPADTTPELMAIADEGVLFRNSYAASSYTIPSTMSIMTGLDPAEHGVVLDFARLSDEVTTLAEALSSAGYRTQAYVEGAYVADRFGFDRGFDAYDQDRRLTLIDERLPEVLRWMSAAGDSRYFLFLQTYHAHYPYGGYRRYRRAHPERGLPSKREIGRLRKRVLEQGPDDLTQDETSLALIHNHFARTHDDFVRIRENRLPDAFPESEHFELDRSELVASYDTRIGRIDDALGRIKRALVDRGQWEDTLLVVLSDHGEAFFERPRQQRHGYVPFDQVLRVPLVISYPRLLHGQGGRRIDGLAWHLDIMPTILGIAGIPLPHAMQGRDLRPVLLGKESLSPRRSVFPAVLEVARKDQEPLRRVVVQWPFKWIEGDAHFGDSQGLLFDLDEDPGEHHNLRAERAALFESMSRQAQAYDRSLSLQTPVHQESGLPLKSGEASESSPAAMTAEELRQLEALGYIDLGETPEPSR